METKQRHQPPGQTSDSPQRPAQRLSGLTLQFDLDHEIDAILNEDEWVHGDRNSKSLIKEPYLHVVLTALKPGARLDRHQTEGPLTIQVLRGRLRVAVMRDSLELERGRLLAIDADVPHEVESLDESVFLITLGWPR
jgi:quercetin dioxygenase-like cupin family protein